MGRGDGKFEPRTAQVACDHSNQPTTPPRMWFFNLHWLPFSRKNRKHTKTPIKPPALTIRTTAVYPSILPTKTFPPVNTQLPSPQSIVKDGPRVNYLERLPDEILSTIFEYCLLEEVRPNVRRAPLVLGRVCHRWREVANVTPRLWANISLVASANSGLKAFTKKTMVEWLEKSRSSPLKLRFTDDGGGREARISRAPDWKTDLWKLVLDVFLPHSSRWEELTCFLNAEQVKYVLSSVPNFGGLPSLKFLALYSFGTPGSGPPTLDLPVLEKVQVMDIDLGERCNFSISCGTVQSLRDLRVHTRGSLADCHDYLQLLPNLESLYISAQRPTLPKKPRSTTLPSLQTLTIFCHSESQQDRRAHVVFGFLDSLSLPSLKELALHGVNPEGDHYTSYHSLEEFFVRSHPPLKVLAVSTSRYAMMDGGIVGSLHLCPHLEVLNVVMKATAPFLEALTVLPNEECDFLPRLRELHVDINDPKVLTRFQKMVVSRCAGNQLQKLYIHHLNSISNKMDTLGRVKAALENCILGDLSVVGEAGPNPGPSIKHENGWKVMTTHKLCDLPILSTVEKLALSKGKIYTAAGLLLLSPQEVAKRTNLPVLSVERLVERVCHALRKEPATLSERKELDYVMHDRITTGNQELDMAIGGGICTGMIWELVGESASGKTQLALQLSLFAQLPIGQGGLSGGTCYLTTTSKLPTTRLLQMLDHNPLLSGEHCSLSDIHTVAVPTLQILAHILETVFPELVGTISHQLGKKPIKLLIIDSVSPLFYSAGKSSSVTLFERGKALADVAQRLHFIAENYQIAVLVVNEVLDAFDRALPHGVAEEGEVTYSSLSRWFNRAHSLPGESNKEAALGLVWANQINSRIMMTRTRRRRNLDGFGGPVSTKRARAADNSEPSSNVLECEDLDSDQAQLLRRLTVVFTPFTTPVAMDYIVVARGVVVVPGSVSGYEEPPPPLLRPPTPPNVSVEGPENADDDDIYWEELSEPGEAVWELLSSLSGPGTSQS